MTNRQDRRFAAKMARQATKRGKTPAERALFGAAAACMNDQPVDLDFALDDFDAAWQRLEPALHELMEGRYDEFRRDVFAEAAWQQMVVTSPSGEERPFDLELVVFPVSGSGAQVQSFVNDPAKLDGLATSLRQSGLFAEDTAIEILPMVFQQDMVDLHSVGPAATARLTLGLIDLLAAETPKADRLAAARVAVRDAGLPAIESFDALDRETHVLLAICLAPAQNWDISDEEAEARYLARRATRASWRDTYAADLPFHLEEPVFWHEAGSCVAWHQVLERIEAGRRDYGSDAPVTRIDSCLCPPNNDTVLAVQVGEKYLGPFLAPQRLVVTDLDNFIDLAERFAGDFVDHETIKGLLQAIGKDRLVQLPSGHEPLGSSDPAHPGPGVARTPGA